MLLLSVLVALSGVSAAVSELQVTLSQGIIKAQVWKSRDNRNYYAFLSIPYAQAGRFEPPKEAGPWDGILEASDTNIACAQSFWITNKQVGKEDCLELSVYTTGIQGKLPVLVYFHGGGFTIGAAPRFKGGYFADEDVILVTANYRLGPLGFLSTGDDILPGNLGLKDQSMALRWVQKHITKFGGDPDRVTIGGGSAGGASVHYHMISPLSAGLFHGALSLSGTVLCPWVFDWNPQARAKTYAEKLNCPTDCSKAMVTCLKNKSLKELLDGAAAVVEWGYDPFTPFAPTVEADTPGESFLSETPESALRHGRVNKVPWMTGVVEDEGLMMHAGYVITEEKLMKDLRQDWKRVFPITFEYNSLYSNFTQAQQDEISEKIYKFYFGQNPVGEETFQQLTNLYSDRFFNHCFQKGALMTAKSSPVYAYLFTEQRSDFSSLQLIDCPPRKGVGHADEYSFLFNEYHTAPEHPKGSNSEAVSKRFTKLVASFIKQGKPVSTWGKQKTWDPISPEEISGEKPFMLYEIAYETALIQAPFTKRYEFWENLLSSFNSPTSSKDEL